MRWEPGRRLPGERRCDAAGREEVLLGVEVVVVVVVDGWGERGPGGDPTRRRGGPLLLLWMLHNVAAHGGLPLLGIRSCLAAAALTLG